jgi:hypothetical protein
LKTRSNFLDEIYQNRKVVIAILAFVQSNGESATAQVEEDLAKNGHKNVNLYEVTTPLWKLGVIEKLGWAKGTRYRIMEGAEEFAEQLVKILKEGKRK